MSALCVDTSAQLSYKSLSRNGALRFHNRTAFHIEIANYKAAAHALLWKQRPKLTTTGY